MYKLTVNGDQHFNLSYDNNKITYNDNELEIDLNPIDGTAKHVIYKNKSFNVELIEHKKEENAILLKVNSKAYLVKLTDEYDELLHKLGFDKKVLNQVTELKAPMPGLVLDILVQEGQQIAKGDNLIILEAMKMENIIKSPVDSVIKQIKINRGDKLEKNQVMVTFD